MDWYLEDVCIFDGLKFTTYELPAGLIDTTVGVSSAKMVHYIMQDSKGQMWFSTKGGDYIKSNNVLTSLSEKNGLYTSFVNEVIETQTSDFLISTSNGLYRYKSGKITDITNTLFNVRRGSVYSSDKKWTLVKESQCQKLKISYTI